jgi:hypothetical protein
LSIEPLWQARALIEAQHCSSLRGPTASGNGLTELGQTSVPILHPIVLSTVPGGPSHAAINYSLDTTFEDGYNIQWQLSTLDPHTTTTTASTSAPGSAPVDPALFSSSHSAAAADAATSQYTTASYSPPYQKVSSVPITLTIASNHHSVHAAVGVASGVGSTDRTGFWNLRATIGYQFLIGGTFQLVLRAAEMDAATLAKGAVIGLCGSVSTDLPCIVRSVRYDTMGVCYERLFIA